MPGIAIRSDARRTVESIEILIEVHTEDGDPVVGVYIGDGTSAGLDITTETAERLVRRLGDALQLVGAAQRRCRLPQRRAEEQPERVGDGGGAEPDGELAQRPLERRGARQDADDGSGADERQSDRDGRDRDGREAASLRTGTAAPG